MSFENMGTVVEDKVFGWEDEITAEGGNKSYTLLEEGDYPFIIKEIERSMYEPKKSEQQDSTMSEGHHSFDGHPE